MNNADIRNFFGGGSASKKPKESATNNHGANKTTKSKSQTPAKRDRSVSKERKTDKKKTPSKQKKSRKVSEGDSDCVDIICDSESDDFTSLKKNKTSGKSKNRQGAQSKDKEEVSPEAAKENSTRRANSKKAAATVSSDDEKPLEDKPSSTKKSRSKASKPKKAAVIFDSESEDEEPLSLPEKQKKKSKSKRPVLLDDSDDDEDNKKVSPKTKPSIKDAFERAANRGSACKTTSNPHVSPDKKQVSLTDFFGVGAVNRTDRKSHSVKRKSEVSPVKAAEDDVDMEIHDDDDFEETLKQLDVQNPPKRIKLEPDEASGSSHSQDVTSLASKLAEKSRKDKVLVPETPDKPTKKTPMKLEKSVPKKQTEEGSDLKQISPGSCKSASSKSPGKTKLPVKSPPSSPVKPASGRPSTSKTPEEKGEKKTGVGYRSYLNREGPRALGSKEIPQGADNCLEGLTFIVTGVLESLERDEAKHLIEKYGGKVTSSLSRKTSYLVVGRDAGESKLAKAANLGTKQLDEDGLLDLIKKQPGKKSKYVEAAEKALAEEAKSKLTKFSRDSPSTSGVTPKKLSPSKTSIKPSQAAERKSLPAQTSDTSSSRKTSDGESLLWVDKHKPQSLKQVIGQQGDKSNARKLAHWIQNWHRNVAAGKKPSFNRFSDDGSGYRAALLSGPPGVGKTTCSQLVCKEMGFSYVELNASDTRSKKSLQTEVSEALNNHTLVDFMGSKRVCGSDGQKHCLIMDEVDGMAGNEDRGGMQELIQLIKHTKIPVICMCNDRNHIKIRSLANYCFDLRFQRPRVEQIKAAMMTLAFKEGLKIPPPALNEIILAANQDVRQVIHNLSMWTASEKTLSYEQAKQDSAKAKKDMKLGPFDVCRKVFASDEETRNMSLNDKSDLFFNDYSFGPLFVQENYVYVNPNKARGDTRLHLQCLSRAADSISQGDLVERKIRSAQNWSLLPTQAVYASVLPGEEMRGGMGQMIQFPSWLGKNSSRGKHERIIQQMQYHMSLNISAGKRALNLDYLPFMRESLTRPLVECGSEGVSRAVDHLVEYDLTRDDFDSVLEVTTWPNSFDPMSKVESKVKAAFTRAFNKGTHLTPYATGMTSKRGRGGGGGGAGGMDELYGLEGEGEASQAADSDDDADDISKDIMIKQKKSAPRKDKDKSKSSKDIKKGKGRGKGSK